MERCPTRSVLRRGPAALSRLFFAPARTSGSLDRRTTALAGTFTLAFGGLDLLTYFNTLVVPYSSAETTLLSARDLIGGVSVAMLFTVVLTRKSAKVVMIISCGLFVAFNLFLLALYIRFHRVPTVRIFLMGDGWFLGVGVTSAILTWLGERRKRGENGRYRSRPLLHPRAMADSKVIPTRQASAPNDCRPHVARDFDNPLSESNVSARSIPRSRQLAAVSGRRRVVGACIERDLSNSHPWLLPCQIVM